MVMKKKAAIPQNVAAGMPQSPKGYEMSEAEICVSLGRGPWGVAYAALPCVRHRHVAASSSHAAHQCSLATLPNEAALDILTRQDHSP